MRQQRANAREALEKTRDVIRAFTGRDMERFLAYLDEDFTFLADDAPLFLRGKAAFLESTRAEGQTPPVSVSDEEYLLLAQDYRLCVTFGRFTASTPPMRARIHFTFVWRQTGDKLLLIHASASHVRDIPAEVLSTAPDTDAAQAHMFDTPQIRAAVTAMGAEPQRKRSFRDLDGHIRYLADSELMYVESLGKTSRFHLAGGTTFLARDTLHSLERPGLMIIHRSYLVNLAYVRELCRYKVALIGGEALPVGKARYLAVKDRLQAKESE